MGRIQLQLSYQKREQLQVWLNHCYQQMLMRFPCAVHYTEDSSHSDLQCFPGEGGGGGNVRRGRGRRECKEREGEGGGNVRRGRGREEGM